MEKFIENIAEILEVSESDIKLEEEFRSFESWDSLAQLSFLVLAEDEYDVALTNEHLQDAVTFFDLLNLLKLNK
jgi:acyl carrier protein